MKGLYDIIYDAVILELRKRSPRMDLKRAGAIARSAALKATNTFNADACPRDKGIGELLHVGEEKSPRDKDDGAGG